MDVRKQLFDRITTLREKAGLSASDLSTAIDHQKDYFYKVKKGVVFPSVVDLEKIANVCGSSLEELFYENFASYKVDKVILDKVKAVTPKADDALMSLFAVLYEENKVTKNRKEESK